tara:strand:- start:11667 stop:12407 length:741 start_codon:yes stop_codon:yes gene_type:complete
MLKINVVSLIPEIIEPVCKYGVIGRACQKGLVEVSHINPRDFALDKHNTVDDRPFGGGPGMVLKYEPVRDAIHHARKMLPNDSNEFVLSAKGKVFDNSVAYRLSKTKGILLVAGRFEGIDERIIDNEITEQISVGDYILTGGEVAATVIIDSVVRLIPGVLGDENSSKDDSFMGGLLGFPQYTRPASLDKMSVPNVLLEGNHEAIRIWRLKQSLGATWINRPELIKKKELTEEEKALLDEFIHEKK